MDGESFNLIPWKISESMQFLIILFSLSIWSICFLSINCLPNSRSHLPNKNNAAPTLEKIRNINTIDDSLIPYDQPPITLDSTIDILSTRSTNATGTGVQGRKSHIAYLDFSFLIWSDAHTHLLKTMTNDFRTAAISAANDFALGVRIGAKYGTMTFTYGAFILVIYYIDKQYLIGAILEVFFDVLEVMYPVTYSIVWCGMVASVCHMEGYIDGKSKWGGYAQVGG